MRGGKTYYPKTVTKTYLDPTSEEAEREAWAMAMCERASERAYALAPPLVRMLARSFVLVVTRLLARSS